MILGLEFRESVVRVALTAFVFSVVYYCSVFAHFSFCQNEFKLNLTNLQRKIFKMSRISRETMHAICRDIKVTRPVTHNEKHGMVYISAWAGAHPKPLQAYADMYRYFVLSIASFIRLY